MVDIIFACSGTEKIAKEIAKKLNLPFSKLQSIKFPDGELDVSFGRSLNGKDVFIVQNFQNTKEINLNDKIIETLFAIYTARDLKARNVYLIATYFPYFRGDARFKDGGCISIKVMNKLFEGCDKIFCVDPHLHRIKNIKNALSNGIEINLDEPIIEYLKKKNIVNPIFVGPDIESVQWIVNVAKAFKQKPVVALKERKSAREVVISLPKIKTAKGRDIIIIDDIISTGHTIIENIKQLKKYEPRKFYVIGIHGLFTENALPKLKKYATIVSTNTLNHNAETIDVSSQIAKIVRKNI